MKTFKKITRQLFMGNRGRKLVGIVMGLRADKSSSSAVMVAIDVNFRFVNNLCVKTRSAAGRNQSTGKGENVYLLVFIYRKNTCGYVIYKYLIYRFIKHSLIILEHYQSPGVSCNCASINLPMYRDTYTQLCESIKGVRPIVNYYGVSLAKMSLRRHRGRYAVFFILLFLFMIVLV